MRLEAQLRGQFQFVKLGIPLLPRSIKIMVLAGVHQSIPGLQQVTGKILFLNDLSDALDALSVPALA
jgi:hypothetical protein